MTPPSLPYGPPRRWARTARWGPALVLAASLAAGCTSGDDPGDPGAEPASPTTATAVPAPELDRCFEMPWERAVAATDDSEPVACDQRHDTVTFAVGDLDDLADGHQLAVDSTQLQRRVSQTCRQRLGGYLGGSRQDRRLSMLRSVWFVPTADEAESGARWYRCDVVAVAAPERLAPLSGASLRGVLGTGQGRARYGMCATAAPDDPAFKRVICSAKHSWRAVATVDLGAARRYPGQDAVRKAGQERCEDAGRAAAEDPLTFQWGYEWPTRAQWDLGQTYGRCWVPDS